MVANITETYCAADDTTMLAAHLNHAMARNAAAREAYARIHGVEWSPLGTGVELPHTFARGTGGNDDVTRALRAAK